MRSVSLYLKTGSFLVKMRSSEHIFLHLFTLAIQRGKSLERFLVCFQSAGGDIEGKPKRKIRMREGPC